MIPDDPPLLCARCVRELCPGDGDFFVVDINAVADPTPPQVTMDNLDRDHRQEIEQLVEQMNEMSPQELTDQVYRRQQLHLCTSCFQDWIENPTGG